ncbi:class I SAM-dependent rRNA methyltransferase, partial [Candidatus Riflebacteria bacterium]
SISRGAPWVFAESIKNKIMCSPGSILKLVDKSGKFVAWGFYDHNCNIAFRVLTLKERDFPGNLWLRHKIEEAILLRKSLQETVTTGYRMINGEGDGIPGMVCDLYGKTAVFKLDGDGANGFYNTVNIAEFLGKKLQLSCVYQRFRNKENNPGTLLYGVLPVEPLILKENGLLFEVDIIKGQKTGFFFDQRENREKIGSFCQGKSVLNLFSYTGGFSVYAGQAGASMVTSVDIASMAIATANKNWELNNLIMDKHKGLVADTFSFLEKAGKMEKTWDIVIVDPPAFAHSKQSVVRASRSYINLVNSACKVTEKKGLLAVSSCSSHLTAENFVAICQEGIARARRRGRILWINGLGIDHPGPLALPEFRYLKFIILQV